MNILYVNFSFTVGGIERLLIDMVNTAVEDKKNKIFLCIINDHYDNALIREIKKEVNVILLNRPISGNRIKYIMKYTNIIMKNRIDVIHCQCENTVKFSVISKILKPKIRVFLTIHDTKIYINLKKYEVLIDKIICRKIIAISNSVKQEIIKRGIPNNKVVRIYNAINLDKFVYNDNKEFNISKITIGNVSRIMPEKKGQDLLIKAISKLKEKNYNVECIFAGEPVKKESNTVKELINLSKEWNVQNNIKFLGNVEDIAGLLNSIDIFVLPSRYEGFGIALIEAMAKGVHCIASNIDGPKEIIKDNEYGLLFECDNYCDLANKIEYRINNFKIKDKQKIRSYLNQNFDIHSMMKNLYRIYND